MSKSRNPCAMTGIHQIQQRVLLNMEQYHRVQSELSSYMCEKYVMLTYRFGGYEGNKGDIRIRWVGPLVNEWKSANKLVNVGHITDAKRPRIPMPISLEEAVNSAKELDRKYPHDPWWTKYIQKAQVPSAEHKLTLSLQDMWNVNVGFRYILEAYLMAGPDTDDAAVHTSIREVLAQLGLEETPKEMYNKATAYFVKMGQKKEEGEIPARVRQRDPHSNLEIYNMIDVGILPIEFLTRK